MSATSGKKRKSQSIPKQKKRLALAIQKIMTDDKIDAFSCTFPDLSPPYTVIETRFKKLNLFKVYGTLGAFYVCFFVLFLKTLRDIVFLVVFFGNQILN